MTLIPTNEDYQELLKDERANMLFNNIVLQRTLKEALAQIERLEKLEKLLVRTKSKSQNGIIEEYKSRDNQADPKEASQVNKMFPQP